VARREFGFALWGLIVCMIEFGLYLWYQYKVKSVETE
jgi:hypothetical protein